MGSPAAARPRHDHHLRLISSRATTDQLFEILHDEAFYERPIAERHRIIFYLGHVEAFDWNLLAQRAFGLQSFDPTFDQLFAFGIDPVSGGLPTDQPSDWPKRGEVDRFNERLKSELDQAIVRALRRPSDGHPQLAAMLEVAVEHRLMHAETLASMLQQLPAEKKIPRTQETIWKTPRAKSHLVEIPAGRATLGLRRVNGDEFGWDNEFEARETRVADFAIDNYNVKNRDFMSFVQAGGYAEPSLWDAEGWAWKQKEDVQHPAFWRRSGNLWMYRTMFGDIQLPMDWPVYVSHAEATAYAKWLGRKLPTAEPFHRAAYGNSDSEVEPNYSWGDEAPDGRYGNFDFMPLEPSTVG